MTSNINKAKHTGYTPPENAMGERIKLKRKEFGLSVEGLASLTTLYDYVPNSDGVSPPTIYRYESGGSKPGAREIRLLSLALNVSPCWLITGEEWNKEVDLNADIANAVKVLFNNVLHKGEFTKSNTERNQEHEAKLFEVRINDNVYEEKPD